MILRSFLLLITTGRIQSQAQDPADDRPNIIFVITDDLGWSDVSWNNLKTNSTPFMADLIHSGQASSLRNSYATHRTGFCDFLKIFRRNFRPKLWDKLFKNGRKSDMWHVTIVKSSAFFEPFWTKSASLGGLEPPTFRLTVERANRLRHRDLSPVRE